jgi:hypothetical protein
MRLSPFAAHDCSLSSRPRLAQSIRVTVARHFHPLDDFDDTILKSEAGMVKFKQHDDD